MSTRTRTTALAGTLVLASLALAAPASPAAARGQVPAAGTQEAERKEYVVLATNEASVAAAQAAVVAAGGQVTAVNTDVGLLTVEAPAEGFAAAVSANTAVTGVAENRAIGQAPENGRKNRWEDIEKVTEERAAARPAARTAAAPGAEPLADLQWDMRMIKATPQGSYKVNPGRKGVLVGIIDTGVDGSHPDIAPNFNAALSRNFTTDIEDIDGACADDPDGSCEDAADVDENGHGTHVAGTIGSPLNGLGIGGVAPNVTLVNLRAGQDSGFFFLAATVDALTYAGRNGIDVVNMSFYIDPWLYNCAANPADSAAASRPSNARSSRPRSGRCASPAGTASPWWRRWATSHTDLGNPDVRRHQPRLPGRARSGPGTSTTAASTCRPRPKASCP